MAELSLARWRAKFPGSRSWEFDQGRKAFAGIEIGGGAEAFAILSCWGCASDRRFIDIKGGGYGPWPRLSKPLLPIQLAGRIAMEKFRVNSRGECAGRKGMASRRTPKRFAPAAFSEQTLGDYLSSRRQVRPI